MSGVTGTFGAEPQTTSDQLSHESGARAQQSECNDASPNNASIVLPSAARVPIDLQIKKPSTGVQTGYSTGVACCVNCKNFVLQPSDQRERKRHNLSRSQQQQQTLKPISKQKTCGICLEVVHEKPFRKRRFAILENCDHSFCCDCLKTWRRSSQYRRSVREACPICRICSNLVVITPHWIESGEEKTTIFETSKNSEGNQRNSNERILGISDRLLRIQQRRNQTVSLHASADLPSTYTGIRSFRNDNRLRLYHRNINETAVLTNLHSLEGTSSSSIDSNYDPILIGTTRTQNSSLFNSRSRSVSEALQFYRRPPFTHRK